MEPRLIKGVILTLLGCSALGGHALAGPSAEEIMQKSLLSIKVVDSTTRSTFRLINAAGQQRVRETGDPLDDVPGIVFRITPAELAAADAYEVADCKRVTVRLGSGIDAFVYVDARS